MAQPSTCFLSHSDIVLARDFGENIPSYLHHKMKNSQVTKVQSFTRPASTREGRTCRTGQFPPRIGAIKNHVWRKNFNLLHGNDVRCIVTHLVQNAFLPEKKENLRAKFQGNGSSVLCYLYSQFRAHCGQ